jgi:hypothetical protein
VRGNVYFSFRSGSRAYPTPRTGVFQFVCPQWVERIGPSVFSPHFFEETTTSDLYCTTDLFSQFDCLHQQMATL